MSPLTNEEARRWTRNTMILLLVALAVVVALWVVFIILPVYG